MAYYLQPAFLSPPPPLAITESDYAVLKQSRIVLNAAFSFEENYDILVGNYLEFETTALSIAAHSTARQSYEYLEMYELKAEMNRRAVNFLSSARLFVDQLMQRIGDCGGNKYEVKKRFSAEYDSSFEYRFMEALRNHVQHSGSAVHSVSFGGKWVPIQERSRNEFAIEIFTLRRFLALDQTFKKSVLETCPDMVDTLGATRRYLESLSIVHEFCRNHIEKSIVDARAEFESAIKRYVDFSNASATGLTAFNSSINDPSNAVAIFLDWDDVRAKLSKRNKSLENLSKYVVMSTGT